MTAAILQFIIFMIQEAVQVVPPLAADLKALFANGNPTAADFAALRAKVASETYGQFVPDSQLPLPGTSSDAAAETAANNIAAAQTTVTQGQP